MSRLIFDKINFALDEQSQRKTTAEGYLLTAGRVARTGIQEYMAYEIGLKDSNPNSIVNVYRSPAQVFSKDSLASYKDKDVTLEHPTELVDSRNYKMNTVGHVASVGRQVGDYIEIDMVIKDAGAIEAIESGKVQLSAGYSANFKEREGVHDGVAYTFEQTDIYINHVALVDKARAGNEAKLFDAHKKGIVMYKINFADKSVSIEDENVATIVQSTFDSLNKELDATNKMLDSANAATCKMEAERDSALSELSSLKSQMTDEAMNSRIKSIMHTKETAIKLIGDKFACDSLNEMDIIRHTLYISHPKTDFTGKPDAYLQAYFDADAEKKEAEDEDEEEEKNKAKDSLNNFHQDMKGQSKVSDLRAKRSEEMGQAWRKTIGEA
tara:strand:+ start:1803 stop:2948 length:1146 start_codon:yes stop_codon:yes gene_type:complete